MKRKIVSAKVLADVIGAKVPTMKKWGIPVWAKRKGFGPDTYDLLEALEWLRTNTRGRRWRTPPTLEEAERTMRLTRAPFKWDDERIEDEKLTIADEVPNHFVAHGKLLEKTERKSP